MPFFLKNYSSSHDIFRVCLFAAINISLFACQNLTKLPPPKAVKGVLDLSHSDLHRLEHLPLDGEWEFFPQSLHLPSYFKDSASSIKNIQYFQLPNTWKADMYATLRLKILLKQTTQKYALKIPSVATAYRLYINGRLYYNAGLVGADAQSSVPEYAPTIIEYTPQDTLIELVVHTSNFHYRKGGLWESWIFGHEDIIRQDHYYHIITDFFLIGSFLIVALYSLGLFLIYKQDKYMLYFALLCFWVGLRILTTGNYFILYLLPLQWSWLVKVEFLSFYPSVLFFGAFLHSAFPKEKVAWIKLFLLLSGIVYSLAVIIAPIKSASFIIPPFQAISLLLGIYFLYVLIVAKLRKREGAGIFLAAFLILAITFVNDVFYTANIINTGHIISFGIFIFIYLQAFVISTRFWRLIRQNETLKDELNVTNQNLEKLVIERTQAYHEANEELKIQLERSKKSELQIIQQQNLLTELEKIGRIAAWEYDFQTQEMIWSQEMYSLFTISEGTKPEIEDFSLILKINPEGRELLRKRFWETVDSGESFDIELKTQSENTETDWVRALGKPFRENGRTVKMIGVFQDISEKKKNEDALQMAYRHSQISEQLIRKNAQTLAEKNEELTKTHALLEKALQILEEKNKDITDSLMYAKNIQTAILPLDSKISQSLSDFFVLYMPRDIVSGDFYWFAHKTTPEIDKIIFTVVDCTGHGVPGAFVSMIGDSLLNQIIHDYEIHEADAILNEMHLGMHKTLNQHQPRHKDGMDMSLCVIDRKENTLSFAGAENPLFYVRHGELHQVKGDKYSVGGASIERIADAERIFTKHTILLDEPIMFYLFSDGYQDQIGGERDKRFMASRFRETLLAVADKPLAEQREILATTIDDWMLAGKHPQIDDITVIGIRIS
jgi:serine phosphatase RsbU (regulator of sigma subunit)